MTRTFYSLLACLALSVSVRAQTPSERLAPERLLVKLAPLTLFDPSTSALMLGLEYRPIPRLGLELDYGFRFTGLQPFYWNRDKENLRYQKIKAEVRYYIPRDEKTQWYVAGEAFYVPQEYDLKKGNFYRGGEFRAYDRA
ncbi:MAG TPA: hypothetical protein VK364_05325, partial [Hymenobacter sp.]|nr:hypothetical protein [Hymenobacter sp.]